MKLSIIVVNYNVRYFLEQCLISTFRALEGIEGEVLVVDNASVDGSCQMVRERFPGVRLIENRVNYGFSYANNQALRLAQGEYVLLLNPDTVVEESTFRKCIGFMDAHPEAGCLGVRMIDGRGRFLPESKRALPSPMVSFYKIFGLSRLFPRSRVFGRYHLGHLDENQTHQIEILPGAFMFIRRAALERVGLLDEAFFMYGEDIDLSYRILKGGYKNFYFPETTIIHYKGESTKKGSINYVLTFYKAMMIFARKHFSRKHASVYILLIYLAIYLRAFLSIARRFADRVFQPALDGLVMLAGFAVIIPLWERFRFRSTDAYPDQLVHLLIGAYIAIWLISCWLSGAYDKPRRLLAAARGVGIGTLIILAGYALLPEEMRFSRAIILMAALWATVFVQLIHLGIGLIRADMRHTLHRRKRIAMVGSKRETERALGIVRQAGVNPLLVGIVAPTQTIDEPDQLATIDQLEEFVRVNRVEEIIFCAGDIPAQDIIRNMLALASAGVDYKIAPPESLSVIGSNSINTSGDLYTIEISAISKPSNRRHKRLLDIAVAVATLALAPLLMVANRHSRRMLRLALPVLFGQLTWVGYAGAGPGLPSHLPRIRAGVFTPVGADAEPQALDQANLHYAQRYSVGTDLLILWNQLTRRRTEARDST